MVAERYHALRRWVYKLRCLRVHLICNSLGLSHSINRSYLTPKRSLSQSERYSLLSAAVCKSIGAPALAEMQKLNQEGATQIRRSIVMHARALKPDSRSGSHVLQIIIWTKQNITRGKSSIVKEETKAKEEQQLVLFHFPSIARPLREEGQSKSRPARHVLGFFLQSQV